MRWRKVKGMSMSTPNSHSGLLVIGKKKGKKKRKTKAKKFKGISILGAVKPIGKEAKKFRLRYLQKKRKTKYN